MQQAQIEIDNVGGLPAKEVVITLFYHKFLEGEHFHDANDGHSQMRQVDPGFDFDPPIEFETSTKEYYHSGGQFTLKLKSPIGPGQKVVLTFLDEPCRV